MMEMSKMDNIETGFIHEKIYIGRFAGPSKTTGSINFFPGINAVPSKTTGSRNSFIGTAAGRSNTTGSGDAPYGYGKSSHVPCFLILFSVTTLIIVIAFFWNRR